MPDRDQGKFARHFTALQTRIPSAFRDFFILAGGSGFGQLVIVAVTPVLTRLLLPSDLGLFGTFIAIVAVLSVISSLGFDTAIIGAKPEDAVPLVGIACWVTTVVCVFAAVAAWLLHASKFMPELPPWVPWLATVDVFFANCFTAGQYWYVREQRYKRAGLGSFALNTGRGVGSVVLATALPGTLVLPVGDCLGRALGVSVLDRQRVVPGAFASVIKAPRNAWMVARRYWKSAVFLMPSAAVETAVFWLPALLSSAIYGIDLGGQVALAQRLLSAPLSLVGKSLSDVYQVRITGHGKFIPGRVMRITLTVIGGTIGLAIPVCLILAVWGAPIFILAFGANWGPAGTVVAIMAPVAAFQLCGNVVTRLLIEIGRQELKLFTYLALLISMLLNFYAGSALQWNFFATLSTMSICACSIFAVWIAASMALCWRLNQQSKIQLDDRFANANRDANQQRSALDDRPDLTA